MSTPDQSALAAAEKAYVDELNFYIQSKSCVLLLGPQFGLDKNGNKVHSLLKRHLENTSQVSLDQEFDNLCISRKPDGSETTKIMTGIKSFFERTERSPVYDQLIRIGFQSIISFSFDTFLDDANTSVGGDYDFQYFNKKGDNIAQGNQAEDFSKKPVIYNVFGKRGDINSLIVDYDSLYDFFLSIISADSQIPLQLKNIIGKANAFLFLGFDLGKWYLPILIRKLNQFISNNRSRTHINGYACLDDTPDRFNPSRIDDLNKYPLKFSPFRCISTTELIDQLLPPKTITEEKVALLQLTEEQISFFKNWRNEVLDKSAPQLLDDFFATYKKLGYTGESKSQFEGQSLKYRGLQQRKSQQVLMDEEFNTGTHEVVFNLGRIIDSLLSDIHGN